MVKIWNAQMVVVIKERDILKNIDIDGEEYLNTAK